MAHLGRFQKCSVCNLELAPSENLTIHIMKCSAAAAKELHTFQGLLGVGKVSEKVSAENSKQSVKLGQCLQCFTMLPSEYLLRHLLDCHSNVPFFGNNNNSEPQDMGSTMKSRAASRTSSVLKDSLSHRPRRNETKSTFHDVGALWSGLNPLEGFGLISAGKGSTVAAQNHGRERPIRRDCASASTAPKPNKKTYKRAELPSCVTRCEDSQQLYQCLICCAKFKTKQQGYYHEYCLHPEKEKPFQCSKCPKSFITRSHFDYHMVRHAGQTPFTCDDCGKGFQQRSKLNRHVKQVHEGLKPYTCDVCNKRFFDHQVFMDHRNSHSYRQPYACSYCDKKFGYISSRSRHEKSHEGRDEFLCDVCGKTYQNYSSLKVHKLAHTNQRPFCCQHVDCIWSFQTRKDLRRHVNSVHGGEEAKPFECGICYYRSSRRDHLRRHRHQVHPNMTAELPAQGGSVIGGNLTNSSEKLPFNILEVFSVHQ